jgi:hypothetical protein
VQQPRQTALAVFPAGRIDEVTACAAAVDVDDLAVTENDVIPRQNVQLAQWTRRIVANRIVAHGRVLRRGATISPHAPFVKRG